MSGRIRTIKPELLEDAVTAGITDAAFRLYIGSLLVADDFGNLRADPRKLRGDVFWAQDAVSTDAVEFLLMELWLAGRSPTGPGLLHLYTVRGQRYAHVRNWERHQKIDRRGNPRCPKHDSEEAEEYQPTGDVSTSPRRPSERAPATPPPGPKPRPPAPDIHDSKETEQCPPTARLSTKPRRILATDLDLDLDHDQDLKDRRFAALPGAAAPGVCVITPTEPPLEPEATALRLQPGLPTSRTPEREVFEHWVAGWKRFIHGTRVPKLDEKRRGKIRARLREGFTVDDLKHAVDGLWASSWHIANHQHDIELVCRDAPHVDTFAAKAPPRSIVRLAEDLTKPDEEYPPMTPTEIVQFERDMLESGTTPLLRSAAALDREQGSMIRLSTVAETGPR